MPTLDRVETGSTVPVVGPCPRATGENEMMLLSQNLSRERIRDPEVELAQRVRALRRARRDARTRAARVRRALLAPTPAGDPYGSPPARRTAKPVR
ncbi:hypothetical protein ACFY4C_30240 [Actinomadura viridis]|uniref:hypothetical protein n=1 Tax=Actinomadura viridis TaxID=58110 RepID=UPI003683371F